MRKVMVTDRARAWIEKNRSALKKAGFVRDDVVGPNSLSTLIAWENPGVKVRLSGHVVLFSWKNFQGNLIVQTFIPACYCHLGKTKKLLQQE